MIIDYCLTVRGTVGIEAACCGMPVITAGSGRNDNIDFTIDHKSKQSYKKTLDNILKIKKNNNSKSYLAIAFAHSLFCKKTFEIKNINLTFKRDKNFTLNADLNTYDVYNPVNLKSLSK